MDCDVQALQDNPFDEFWDFQAQSSAFSMRSNLENLGGHFNSEGLSYFDEGLSNAEVSAEGNSKDEVLSNSGQEFLSGLNWSSSCAGADGSSTADIAMLQDAEEAAED